MLKAAIEKIQEMSRPLIREVEDKTFYFHDGEAEEIRPILEAPATLDLHSLEALVKMIQTEAVSNYDAPFYITIPTYKSVRCFSQPDSKRRYERNFYYQVIATDVPGWADETTLKFEEAMIALRSRFQPTTDADYALKLLSDITNGSKVTYTDNGIATSVVTKTGVSLQTNEPIRPIVNLKPYRTFQEVEQPSSPFLIRINERGILFKEADGGMWKLTARQTIKKYFEEALKMEIENGTVVVGL